MKWKKGKIDTNEDKTIDCWRSDCHGYIKKRLRRAVRDAAKDLAAGSASTI